ncbi:MAG: uracil-xanthine permease [Candidatus Cloacimonetes bacterium]|jgi:uracil permease|nr:uracil-xanthine permease [Candidatus Cloacimonadota bacterium]MBT4332015.1 uracil-xanthine permease [Candidatus Cloacimonadota bacterium]MBT5420791.1 uracil-xanthine permease [Candidatus Cloacimonadota bacterium]
MKDLNGKNFVLGFQHMFVMFGATVLVPLITGLDVGVTLFAAGIGTLLFHFLTKFEVPVFLGSSFAFIPGIIAVATAEGGSLPEALGGIVIAGLLYVVVAFIFRFIDAQILHKILPPFVTGPIIVLIGLILAPVAINNANGTYAAGVVEAIGVNGCWLVALFTFAVAVFVKVFFEKTGAKLLSMLPVLIALIAGYVLSIILGIVDFTVVKEAAWFGLPKFSLPVFTTRSISIIVPIAIVTIVEHFGDILAIGNVVGKDFIKKPGIHKTLLGDGLATSLSAMIGGPANTTYSENTGAVALTGNYNPIIMRIAAVCAVVLSFVPKFTSIISTIPGPVIGGISILLFGMISSIGIKNMVDHKVDFTNAKILMITAAMLVLGLGGAKFAFGNFQLEGLGLAAIVGVLMNLILNFGEIKKKN